MRTALGGWAVLVMAALVGCAGNGVSVPPKRGPEVLLEVRVEDPGWGMALWATDAAGNRTIVVRRSARFAVGEMNCLMDVDTGLTVPWVVVPWETGVVLGIDPRWSDIVVSSDQMPNVTHLGGVSVVPMGFSGDARAAQTYRHEGPRPTVWASRIVVDDRIVEVKKP